MINPRDMDDKEYQETIGLLRAAADRQVALLESNETIREEISGLKQSLANISGQGVSQRLRHLEESVQNTANALALLEGRLALPLKTFASLALLILGTLVAAIFKLYSKTGTP